MGPFSRRLLSSSLTSRTGEVFAFLLKYDESFEHVFGEDSDETYTQEI